MIARAPRPSNGTAHGAGVAPGARLVDEREAWERLVLGLPDAALEQGWEWGEVLRASRASTHRIGVVEGDRGLAAASIVAWRLPVVRGSVLYASRGPLVEDGRDDAWPPMMAMVHDLAERMGAVFLRVSPAAFPSRRALHDALLRHGFTPIPEEWTVWNAPKIVMTLPLGGAVSDVWSGISGSRRREIRAAESAGIGVEPLASSADLVAFHRLLLQTGRRKRLPVRRARHFESVWRHYGAAGTRFAELARHRGRLVGGLIGARFGGCAYFLYSAVERDHGARDVPTAGPLLYWRFIRWATESGCRLVHWGGSATHLPPCEDDPGLGLYRFKRSFGSSCVGYLGYYDLVFRPRAYAALRRLERRLGESAWRFRALLNR